MTLTSRDRLEIGRARARYTAAIRQLTLALERGDNETLEAAFRAAMAALTAGEGVVLCRRLARRLDPKEET